MPCLSIERAMRLRRASSWGLAHWGAVHGGAGLSTSRAGLARERRSERRGAVVSVAAAARGCGGWESLVRVRCLAAVARRS